MQADGHVHLIQAHVAEQLLHGCRPMEGTPGQVGSSYMPDGGVGHQAVGIRQGQLLCQVPALMLQICLQC